MATARATPNGRRRETMASPNMQQRSSFMSPQRRSVNAPSSLPFSPNLSRHVDVGDHVDAPGRLRGIVRYVGNVSGKTGVFVGIDLDSEHHARGKNDGSVAGIRYFKATGKLTGIFAPAEKVSKVDESPATQASRPISMSPSQTSTPSPRDPTTKPNRILSPPSTTPTNTTARRSINTRLQPQPSKMQGPLSPKAAPITPTTNRRTSSSIIQSPAPSNDSRASITPRPRTQLQHSSMSFQSRDGPTSEMLPPPRSHSAASSISSVTSLDPQSVQIEKLQRKIAALTEELVRLRDERQGDEVVQLARQRQRVKELEKLATDRHAEVLTKSKELEEASNAHNSLQASLEEMMKEIDRLQKYVSKKGGGEVQALRARIEELEGQAALQELTEKNEFIAELETELSLAYAQIAEDEKQSKVVLEKIASLEKVVEEIERDLHRERETNAELRNALDKQPKMQPDEDKVEGMKVIIDELTKENQQLRSRPKSTTGNADVDRLQREIADLERMVERKVFREEELEREIERLRAGDLVPSDKKAAFSSFNQSQTPKASTAYCEICETHGHDILSCPKVFGDTQANGSSREGNFGEEAF